MSRDRVPTISWNRTPSAPPSAPPQSVTDRRSARLDRLPWSRWHWPVVMAPSTVWILAGSSHQRRSMSEALKSGGTGLGVNSLRVRFAGAVYVAGTRLGGLFFGQMTDPFGGRSSC